MEIDWRSDVPSYLQLADILRQRIQDGTYAPGDPIPSITDMTGETGLAIGTVRKAIAVLVAEGLVRTVPGRATYVEER